jgi:hypothetical protein
MRSNNSSPKPAASGQVTIMLEDEEIILEPSYRVMNLVSRQFGGLEPARGRLAAENIDAMAFVIRYGSGMNDREARDLGERIYNSGVSGELVVPLINYVVMLGNKGTSLADEGREQRARPQSAEGHSDSADGGDDEPESA